MEQLFTPGGLAVFMIILLAVTVIAFIIMLARQSATKKSILKRLAQMSIEQNERHEKETLHFHKLKEGADVSIKFARDTHSIVSTTSVETSNFLKIGNNMQEQLNRIEAETKNEPVRDEKGKYRKRGKKPVIKPAKAEASKAL